MTILGGRWALVELAGRGASGEVHRALDGATGKVVAVKMLGEKLVDEQSRERFAREIRILAAVRNPHVVAYVGHGAEPGPFVVVEWLEGEDLAQRQRRRALTGREIVDVIEQAADGLADLHALGVVHRDLKPSNVFLSERPDGSLHVTVIDLGIASVAAEVGLTSHGTLIGTPSYMPPEQILGVGLTARSDVFSLGVVLFELVTGQKPFTGDDIVTLVAKIALSDPPRVREHVPSAPAELDAIVARAMAKDPGDRFPSITAFAEALASAPAFRSARELSRDAAGEASLSLSRRDLDSLTLSTEERRVVTALLVRLDPGGEPAPRGDAAALFDRVATQYGGAPHALLALARVAIFGGALSIGDEAQRAARAALALQRELGAVALSIATGRGPTDASAVSGEAIERAASEPRGTAPRGVRVDEPTARLLGDAFEVAREGDALWLRGERSAARALRQTLLGKPTPFVGRARELAQLEALFDEVAAEPIARAAIVVGPAGIGKSRLRAELEARIAERHPTAIVLEGRGSALAEGAAFGLVGSAIRGFARLREGEPREHQLRKIGLTIPAPERAALTPHVAQLAGLGAGTTRPGEDGALVSDRLRVAFERWLDLLAADRPVALVLEDAQWADGASIALVDGALRNLRERPILVVALGRPEIERRFPRLWEARAAENLRLAPLPRRACLALLEQVASFGEETVDEILDRAEGNAFFLEELVRAAADRRAPRPSVAPPGEKDRGSIAPPDTVLGIVQARLDALGPEAKRVLKAASVFGEVAWVSGISDVLGPTASEPLESTLDALVAREILERRAEARFDDEVELAFRSALLREAAYELLLDADRAHAHLRAGDWLERHGESESWVLARHFELGGAEARAIPWYSAAAEQALFGGDFPLVIACADKAIACGAASEALGEVHLLVAEAQRWRGDLRAALTSADAAARLLPVGAAAWFSALRELVAAHGRLGNRPAIGPIAALIEEARAEGGAESAQIAALVPAAVHAFYAGDVASAVARAERIEALAAEYAASDVELEPRARARVSQLRAVLASHHDALEDGIAHQLEALEQFDLASDRRAATLVRSNLAFVLLELGDIERASTILRQALGDATQMNLGTIRPLVLQNLGVALARSGRPSEALAAQTEAAEAFRVLEDPRLEGASRVHVAILRLGRGELDEAKREAEAVIAMGVAAIEVGARAVLARALLAERRVDDGLTEARRSIETLERVQNVEELEVYARLTLAEALEQAGLPDDARAALDGARARVEAKRARIRDEALKRSVIERIPEHARVVELSARDRS